MNKFLILLLVAFQGIVAQVKFDAIANKTTITSDEYLYVDFVMNEDGDNFVSPDFEGFEVVNGPNTSISQMIVNGRRSMKKVFSYALMATKTGSLNIKPAIIEINGKLYKTNSLKITVKKAEMVQNNSQKQKKQQGNIGDIYFEAEVSNLNPYINEPIVIDYKIYVSYNVGVQSWTNLGMPNFENFWNNEIDITNTPIKNVQYKGDVFKSKLLKRVVLYPQKSGKIEIDPYVLNFLIEAPTNYVDVFGEPIVDVQNKKVSTGTKYINVKPLPELGKPVNFSGAVGEFNFTVKPSKTALKTGESLDLLLTVSGNGNLKLFTLPKPFSDNSLEIFDPEHKENVNTSISGMSGSIIDAYAIIPQEVGNTVIKPISFSYFDLKTKSYKTIVSPPLSLQVTKGDLTSNNINAKESNNQINSKATFAYIKLKTTLTNSKKGIFLGSLWFYIALLLPFILIPIIVFIYRKKEAINNDIEGNKIKASSKLAKKHLSEAQKQIQNKELFYIALEKAMHNFLKAKLNIETSDMSKDKIAEILLSKKANENSINEFLVVTQNCELARYAPSTTVTIQDDYNKAVKVILELEKQIS